MYRQILIGLMLDPFIQRRMDENLLEKNHANFAVCICALFCFALFCFLLCFGLYWFVSFWSALLRFGLVWFALFCLVSIWSCLFSFLATDHVRIDLKVPGDHILSFDSSCRTVW